MKYDLHVHTHYSRCSNLRPEVILKIAKRRGLDGIAITDHHEIKGALEVKKLNKDKNFEVIVGEEIGTNLGDVLVYYLDKKIGKIDFDEVVGEAGKQGALVVIPHPFRTTFIRKRSHKFQAPLGSVKGKIDAIECFNARMLFNSDNRKADRISDKLKVAKTGGGDSHFFFEIGTGYTIFEDGLRKALRQRKTVVGGTTMLGPFGGILSYVRKRCM